MLAERWESGQDFAQGSLRSEVMAMAWPSSFVVADLGCGTGFLSSQLAPFAKRVIAVDHSPRMLEAAQKKALPRNCEFRQGELDALPIEDESVDAAFANLVWHHLPDLQAAAREVFRILKAGGAVVISDLLPHESEWMRDAMGDLRLGLKPEQVVAALAVGRKATVGPINKALLRHFCTQGFQNTQAANATVKNADGPIGAARFNWRQL
jgi:ArsR family transcriptional regulator